LASVDVGLLPVILAPFSSVLDEFVVMRDACAPLPALSAGFFNMAPLALSPKKLMERRAAPMER
jgi:hypothetical protein